MDVSVIDAAQTVLATLNYSQRTAEKPYAYTYEPPQGVPARSGRLDAAENVPIRDARPFADQLSLEEQGFLLRHHKSAVSDFYDEEQLCTLYYAEIDRLLKVATGAEKVVIFDHTIRSVPRAKLGQAGMREPVRRVHNDYTETSGRRRVRDHLESDEADVRLGQRFMQTGTGVSARMRMSPGRNSAMRPSLVSRPSGKMHTSCPSASSRATIAKACS